MTSYRNQMLSNIQSHRQDLLQMSQKTTVTNKKTNGHAKIGYENDTYCGQSKVQYSPENKENPDGEYQEPFASSKTRKTQKLGKEAYNRDSSAKK